MLATIGYEGASLDDFIKTLLASNVEILIDVRERAQSRRKGFSKTALSTALTEAGIDYLHLRQLGDPKEGRDAARSGDFKKFRKVYSQVLKSEDAKLAIQDILKILPKQNACLLCYERDHTTCHRKIITDNIETTSNIKARHLGVVQFGASSSKKGRMLHIGEGATASV
ncbi:DUF488 family protein [Hyphococcus sp.]|jgi:uncharacterized protein (DUF488 family)|uniref:DUF488 domain-containing protein n=1 Tax=Hyphococcus sp. TaxID=2038636 RepID=UPI003D0C92B8